MMWVVLIAILGGFILACAAKACEKELATWCLGIIAVSGFALLFWGMPWSDATESAATFRTICFIVIGLCVVGAIWDAFKYKFKNKTQQKVISWGAGCAVFLLLCIVGSVVIPVGDGSRGDGKNSCTNCGRKVVVSGGLCDKCYISYKEWEFEQEYLP